MLNGMDNFETLESQAALDVGAKFKSGWVNELRLQGMLNAHERILQITPNLSMCNCNEFNSH